MDSQRCIKIDIITMIFITQKVPQGLSILLKQPLEPIDTAWPVKVVLQLIGTTDWDKIKIVFHCHSYCQ